MPKSFLKLQSQRGEPAWPGLGGQRQDPSPGLSLHSSSTTPRLVPSALRAQPHLALNVASHLYLYSLLLRHPTCPHKAEGLLPLPHWVQTKPLLGLFLNPQFPRGPCHPFFLKWFWSCPHSIPAGSYPNAWPHISRGVKEGLGLQKLSPVLPQGLRPRRAPLSACATNMA